MITGLLAIASPIDSTSLERVSSDALLTELAAYTCGSDVAVDRLHELSEMLSVCDGFTAFERALCVFPLSRSVGWHSVSEWNEQSSWRYEYGDIAAGLLFFAQDVFANQFALDDLGNVVRFIAETGECSIIASTVDEWADVLLADHQYLTGWPLGGEWQLIHGELPPGHRLIPKQLFVTGGEFALENLRVNEEQDAMRFYGSVARQIRDLPEGTEIEVVVR